MSLATSAGAGNSPERLHSPRVLGTTTADRLKEAAIIEFAERGFHATTTRDIAARAGLSPAGVYVHFPSKEDLLYAITLTGHEAALEMLQEAAADSPTPTDALRATVGNFARWHAEWFRDARVVQYEFPHLSHDHREHILDLRKQINAVVADILEAGRVAGDFDIEDVPATTLAVLSMAVDVCRWYDSEIRRSPESIGSSYGELAVRLVSRR
ncbi:MAG: TetR/AcrR family transcriptional regulator [Intrasporangiaceae bacterium]|nr:TetR/AcrR family transcriptional regulator [Intrasporangiaceae bacterium]